jgi:hypothetical protein
MHVTRTGFSARALNPPSHTKSRIWCVADREEGRGRPVGAAVETRGEGESFDGEEPARKGRAELRIPCVAACTGEGSAGGCSELLHACYAARCRAECPARAAQKNSSWTAILMWGRGAGMTSAARPVIPHCTPRRATRIEPRRRTFGAGRHLVFTAANPPRFLPARSTRTESRPRRTAVLPLRRRRLPGGEAAARITGMGHPHHVPGGARAHLSHARPSTAPPEGASAGI